MGKPELGTKRICPSCATKYYDLNRSPIVCPHCGTVFQVTAAHRPERVAAVARPVEKAAPTAEIEHEADVISLEEVEVAEEAEVGPDADEVDETVPEEVAVEGEEVGVGEDDTFLEQEEEEGDVTVLLDVDAEEEEER